MAFTSWIRWPLAHRTPNPTKAPRRQPTRPRLGLESLESRLLLNAGTANQFGFLNNPSVNFNPQSIGVTLPTANPPVSSQVNSNVSLPTLNAIVPNGANGFAAPFAQGQVSDQFRVMGVNSQGQGNQFQVGVQFFSMAALGFGSGVQPNAPWRLAADNVGLANHQFNYSTQSDNGFPSTPPWVQQRYQMTANQPRPDENQLEDNVPPEHVPADQPPTVLVMHEDEPELQRGEPAVEEALFNEPPTDLLIKQLGPRARQLRERGGDEQPIALTEERGIPRSVWMSALAPAQLSALIAGISVVEAPSGEDSGGDAAAAVD